MQTRSLISHITNRNGLRKILANISWLSGDNILRMGVGLFVGVWVARYLGPEQYGTLNYAIALVALFSAFSKLGLDGIVVRNIVQDPASKDETLGTACALKVVGGLFTFVIAITTVAILRPGDTLILWIVSIIAAGMVWHALDVIEYWFQSKVASKYTVFAKTTAFILFSLAKILLILVQAPLIAFAMVALAEVMVGALGLAIVYRLTGHYITQWKFKLSQAKTLLKDSWPLIISGLAIMVYMRIDQIMLGQMVGDSEVGVYSAALKLSEAWYFIPMVISASVFPAIIKAKQQSEKLYYNRLQKLYNLMTWLAISIAIPMTFLSDHLVRFLFGSEYLGSGVILALHIWAAVFVFQGVARSKWMLTENLQKYGLCYYLVGCSINIALNLVLIPKYLGVGAAIATICSQAVVAIVAPALFKKTRISSTMLLKSFVWGGTTG